MGVSVEVPVEAPVEATIEAPIEAPVEAPAVAPVEEIEIVEETPVEAAEAPVEAPVVAPVDAPVEAPVVEAAVVEEVPEKSSPVFLTEVQDESTNEGLPDLKVETAAAEPPSDKEGKGGLVNVLQAFMAEEEK